jgi:hypothetical protein
MVENRAPLTRQVGFLTLYGQIIGKSVVMVLARGNDFG